MRKRFGGVARRISRNAATKYVQQQKAHKPGENQFAGEH